MTPGHLLAIGATTLGFWFLQQPRQERVNVVCKPIALLQEWMAVKESPEDQLGQMMNKAFTRLRGNCPDSIGEPVASLADQVNTGTRTAVKQAADQARTLTNRRIEAVVDGERLRVEALGEAKLLGITVPKEGRAKAMAYLKDSLAGNRVTVTIDSARDPEQRPLVLVTMPDGALLNAQMIKYGLAEPWRTKGPWQNWGSPTKKGYPD